MRFRVEISPEAATEAEEAYLSMHPLYPGQAVVWFNGLYDVIRTLERFPRRCSLVPENTRFREGIRQLLYGKGRGAYRILFTVTEDDPVRIPHIRHAARQTLGAEEEPEPDQGQA